MNEYAGKKAVVTGVPESEAGLASGLVNTSQQMGGALGLAALAAVAAYATGGPQFRLSCCLPGGHGLRLTRSPHSRPAPVARGRRSTIITITHDIRVNREEAYDVEIGR